MRVIPFESHNLFHRDERAALSQRLRSEPEDFMRDAASRGRYWCEEVA